MLKITTSNIQTIQREIQKELAKLTSDKFVTVGIHEEEGEHKGGITNAHLGAVQHFGGDINHPGGTSYGFKSKAGEARNEVRFLKAGKGYLELGKTKAHIINIPARPWLDVGVETGNSDYLSILEKAIKNGTDMDKALEKVGVVAVGKTQLYMTQLKTPANAESTIKKKGSSNPLIDTGELRASVNYKVQSTKPEEGIG